MKKNARNSYQKTRTWQAMLTWVLHSLISKCERRISCRAIRQIRELGTVRSGPYARYASSVL
eukprot:1220641-Rhodomonas_salina.1